MKRKVGFQLWSTNLVFDFIGVRQAHAFGCACSKHKCALTNANCAKYRICPNHHKLCQLRTVHWSLQAVFITDCALTTTNCANYRLCIDHYKLYSIQTVHWSLHSVQWSIQICTLQTLQQILQSVLTADRTKLVCIQPVRNTSLLLPQVIVRSAVLLFVLSLIASTLQSDS